MRIALIKNIIVFCFLFCSTFSHAGGVSKEVPCLLPQKLVELGIHWSIQKVEISGRKKILKTWVIRIPVKGKDALHIYPKPKEKSFEKIEIDCCCLIVKYKKGADYCFFRNKKKEIFFNNKWHKIIRPQWPNIEAFKQIFHKQRIYKSEIKKYFSFSIEFEDTKKAKGAAVNLINSKGKKGTLFRAYGQWFITKEGNEDDICVGKQKINVKKILKFLK